MSCGKGLRVEFHGIRSCVMCEWDICQRVSADTFLNGSNLLTGSEVYDSLGSEIRMVEIDVVEILLLVVTKCNHGCRGTLQRCRRHGFGEHYRAAY